MRVDIRIPRQVYVTAIADLLRPHPFAAERVGFFTSSTGYVDANRLLVLLTGYSSIPDEDYIDDPSAGARIGSKAIRSSLQRILDERRGQFHVHIHLHRGRPGPSLMDSREAPKLAQSMVALDAKSAHGAVILSRDGAWAQAWIPGLRMPVEVTKTTIVGMPLGFLS